MASYLYRTRGILQFPRYVPALISRGQASQNKPSGQGVTQNSDSSVLPPSSTSSDHTNPTKTSSDAPPLDHEHVDSNDKQRRSSSKTSSSSASNEQQSFLSSPIGKFGTIAVLTVAIYAAYKMIGGSGGGGERKDLKKNEHYKRATADYQASNTQGTDVKK